MAKNEAIWLSSAGAPLKVEEAPFPNPGPGQIAVRAAAVAVNPIDWILQSVGGRIFPWLKYPLIPGWDVAGEVVVIGSGVTRFKVGDRVTGLAVGQDKAVNNPSEGAFQTYPILREHMATPLPPDLPFEKATVLPLGISTAACALFQSDQLALKYPRLAPESTGQALLIWGGSTSVGGNAIQLAVAAGYEVFTTASPRNHDYVHRLGAARAFDYRSPSVVRDIVQALRGRTVAGALAISAGSAEPCIKILGACSGNRFVAFASPPVSLDDVPAGSKMLWTIGKIFSAVSGNIRLAVLARRNQVKSRFVNGVTLLHNEVGPLIFTEFLPQALRSGRYSAVPEPLVIGRGLSSIPAALRKQRDGVSARKVVITV